MTIAKLMALRVGQHVVLYDGGVQVLRASTSRSSSPFTWTDAGA
ncbi:MAG: hypothetical protein U0746_16960 [Gemmataceae bacterium]